MAANENMAKPEILELLARVKQLTEAGSPMTVANVFPDLAGKLGPELEQKAIADVFKFDLLAKAPATWLHAPPLPRVAGSAADALHRKIGAEPGILCP